MIRDELCIVRSGIVKRKLSQAHQEVREHDELHSNDPQQESCGKEGKGPYLKSVFSPKKGARSSSPKVIIQMSLYEGPSRLKRQQKPEQRGSSLHEASGSL